MNFLMHIIARHHLKISLSKSVGMVILEDLLTPVTFTISSGFSTSFGISVSDTPQDTW